MTRRAPDVRGTHRAWQTELLAHPDQLEAAPTDSIDNPTYEQSAAAASTRYDAHRTFHNPHPPGGGEMTELWLAWLDEQGGVW